MNKVLMVLCAALSLGLSAFDAEAAKRLGGGGNVGAQRNMTAQPPAKPPAQQATQAAPATQPQQSGMSKWLGPLAGLAIGAGLASMFMNNGLAGGIGGILMIALLVAAAVFAWRMLRAKSGGGALQYAGGNPATAPVPATAGGMPQIGSGINGATGGATATAIAPGRFPPGFDAEQFARHAKTNFARLQEANDKRDLTTMRDFMTPQLYAEIAKDIDPMGPAQHTEVVSLEAEVLEVVSESEKHIASVRFTGSIREDRNALPEAFDEIWHLEKPINGASGWLISGIQQS